MDLSKIQAAISELSGVNVRGGGKYTMVAPRVETFRKFVGAELGIDTDVIVDDDKRVVIKAYIKNKDGFVVASGLAEELRGSSSVNRTAAIENCETSAVGRALASLGLHGGEYASVEEIDKARRNGHVRDERERKAKAQQEEASAEAEYDAAIKEYQNAPQVDQWEVFVDKAKRDMQYKTQTYQLKKLIKDLGPDLENLKELDRERYAELVDFYKARFDEVNTGERRV